MNPINAVYHHTPEKLITEVESIKKAKTNPVHFGPLYKKYHRQIFRYVYQKLDDFDLAKDVTSQVFLKAIKSIENYEFRGLPFSSWLYRIAKSELYQSFRDNQKYPTVNIEFVHLSEMMEVFPDEIKDRNLKRMYDCIKQLKTSEIQLIEMRFFEQQSFKEVAGRLNITENNAKVKCFRILDKLRRLFLEIKKS